MKIRNVKTSILVLVGLIVLSLAFYVSAQDNSSSNKNIFLDSDQDGLSDKEEQSLGTDPDKRDTDNDGYSDGVEVKTGYDPLKPAPGDKLMTEEKKPPTVTMPINVEDRNLTENVAQKITALVNDKTTNGETISLDEVQALASELMIPKTSQAIQLSEIKREDLKIKKQDYSKYSKEKATAKRNEDLTNYIATIAYILSNNSPEPITVDTSLTNVFDSFSQQVIQSISLRDTSSLKELSASGEKIQEQLLEMEIPEDLVDTHIKIIQFARYSKEAEKLLNPQIDDPIADIANLSHLTGLITELISFTNELGEKFSAYELSYDENMQKKLESFGLEVPEDLQELLEEEQPEE